MWNSMISSLVLILVSSLISVAVGFPIGVWSARNPLVYRITAPILDVMQTLPSFVYLVPALVFFNIGPVPAVFATVIFAMPPTIRLIRLGILQVPAELVEAGLAFGTNSWKLLWKVQIPLAMPSIKAGINQTIMLALSMVVIAAMIGAGGLGNNVVTALETVNIGQGFEAGLCIVILAIILDRISQNIGGRKYGN
jgi:glycine betaine/proline transport system permease protein